MEGRSIVFAQPSEAKKIDITGSDKYLPCRTQKTIH